MITITKNARVPEYDGFVVAADDGQYADVDLILCANQDSSDAAMASYQAQFIAYGSMVYQYETPELLGEAIVAIDPESTHDAAQLWREDEARRTARLQGTLTPENPVPAPDATTPDAPAPEADAPRQDDTRADDAPNASDATSADASGDTASAPATEATTTDATTATTTDATPPATFDPVPTGGDIPGNPVVIPTVQEAVAVDLSTTTPE